MEVIVIILTLLMFGIALCFPIAAVTFVYLGIIKPIIEMFRKDNSTSFRNYK